jgi:SOS response regulatory protein OraA/RecX
MPPQVSPPAPGWFQWIASLDDTSVFVSLAIVATMLVIIVGLIASAWRQVRQSEHVSHLTAMMLQRGMSAEEIERVLRSGAFKPAAAEAAQTGPQNQEVQLVKVLSDNSYDGEAVEKILQAARSDGRIDETTSRIVQIMAENWTDTDDIVRVLSARRSAGVGETEKAELRRALSEKGIAEEKIESILACT